ncbi:NAD-dependent succinate-semialdehyde dehydrogenase [Streptomyces sp. SHP 1-2]|uniref:NAD-dependent succinate-semialdehyde dehydrogenase n=1 Tax=Streptomyces sp. SHP 1-2 TaxID=2769489 RepID=UPI00223705E7|nr:NAD-dependent succinate-semialdehyde dehydrogenase [Streptomyces sp. SHP 1-2]MCW5252353.1 NAD-dependent succinate-semialdehyde dehydrogenase [Streptomyces sp. SHP 1-2]
MRPTDVLPAPAPAPATAPTELFIGGAWRPAGDGARFTVHDPATGEPVASVASATETDGVHAVEAAAKALPDWAATPPRERAEILRRAFESMRAEQEELARLIVAENGKALPDARAEVAYAAEFLRWYAEEAVRLSGTLGHAPAGGNRILVMRRPIGVAVLVTPWNFPAAMATRKIGPALAAGCTVVLKPASETPLTALAVAGHLQRAGVPAGVVNVLPSRRTGPLVTALLAHPEVRKISFTGSTEVGKHLLRQAADRVLASSMELGGNAPFLVLADADLDEAVAGAMIAKMRNGGEACTAANRFYAHSSISGEFARRLADAMGRLRVGPGQEDGTDVGPLVNERARAEMQEVVDEAVAAGATVLTGGRTPDGPGWFYPPTVLADVPADSAVLRREIFGPIAPVVTFDTVDEALDLANRCEVGLAGYVYTRDLALGLRVSERLEVGMVGLNRGVVSDPAAPFGGVKESGLGREGGHEGLLEYTESKMIATQW